MENLSTKLAKMLISSNYKWIFFSLFFLGHVKKRHFLEEANQLSHAVHLRWIDPTCLATWVNVMYRYTWQLHKEQLPKTLRFEHHFVLFHVISSGKKSWLQISQIWSSFAGPALRGLGVPDSHFSLQMFLTCIAGPRRQEMANWMRRAFFEVKLFMIPSVHLNSTNISTGTT